MYPNLLLWMLFIFLYLLLLMKCYFLGIIIFPFDEIDANQSQKYQGLKVHIDFSVHTIILIRYQNEWHFYFHTFRPLNLWFIYRLSQSGWLVFYSVFTRRNIYLPLVFIAILSRNFFVACLLSVHIILPSRIIWKCCMKHF